MQDYEVMSLRLLNQFSAPRPLLSWIQLLTLRSAWLAQKLILWELSQFHIHKRTVYRSQVGQPDFRLVIIGEKHKLVCTQKFVIYKNYQTNNIRFPVK